MLGQLSLLERVCCSIIKCGNIPNHIAFIMDGNRRYAKQQLNQIQPNNNNNKNDSISASGYMSGYNTFIHLLDICCYIGISYITVYAFSIDNFNRPQREIDEIMSLAYNKFIELSNNSVLLDKYKIKIKFVGNRNHSSLPQQLKQAIEQCEQNTAHNNNVILNICFIYSTSYEIVQHIVNTATQLKAIHNDHNDTDNSITQQQQLDDIKHSISVLNATCPSVDLLVRTSGETRFSDFMLYQIHNNTDIYFENIYWPQLNLYHFSKIILNWQYLQRQRNKRLTLNK